MRIFQYCYDLALRWSQHKHAPRYLAGLSFSESMFFPIPPDVMLAPMSLAKPSRAWHYALLTTLASVVGGIAGYALGWLAFDGFIQPWVESMGYQAKLTQAIGWFNQYGVWVVFVAGFSPIPYKVFTISAGFLHMAFIPFVIASAIGRGMRFYLVAGLMRWGGEPMQRKLRECVDFLGWLVIISAIVLYLLLR